MCVNFRCGDAFVSKHFLYRTQIGTAFHQMRCKRMSQ